ncbi:MAG: STAS domain-containing protein [Candidatus Cloacimonetes bacterium]|nr:STAS domain-containing protein [Candidatus Cloacimonadota bacterium]
MGFFLTFDNELALLKIVGDITKDNIIQFQIKLSEVLALKYDTSTSDKELIKRFEIDFSQCKLINSQCVNSLLKFYQDFTKNKNEVEIIKCSEQIYELFMTLKLNQLISINCDFPVIEIDND